jgi:soluble epoxide hydrolase/lipid-phosphate phosphatase
MAVLMIEIKADVPSNTLAIQAMKEYVADLKVVEVECGHWVQLEKRNEIAKTLEEFFMSFEEKKW